MIRHGLLLLTVLLFFTVSGMAQVAINDNGSEPHSSAILDINSFDSNKGLLLPRVSITSLSNEPTPVITDPAEGLIVFNTNGSNPDIPKGFYYWSEDDGGKWTQMLGDNNFTTNTWSQAFFQAGELYEVHVLGSENPLSLPVANKMYGWTNATQGESFGDVTFNLASDGDKIIIGEDGLYKVEFTASFSGTNNLQLKASVFMTRNAVKTETRVRFWEKLLSSGDLGSGTANGLLELLAGDEIEIRFMATTSSETIYLNQVNLIVNKVGN